MTLMKFRSAQKSPGPTARPLSKRGLLGDFSGVGPDQCGSFSCAVLYRLVHELLRGDWRNALATTLDFQFHTNNIFQGSKNGFNKNRLRRSEYRPLSSVHRATRGTFRARGSEF